MIRSQSFSEPMLLYCELHKSLSHFFSSVWWDINMARGLELEISFLPPGRREIAGVQCFPFFSELVSDNTPAGYVFDNSFPLRAGLVNKNMLIEMYFKMSHFPLILPEAKGYFSSIFTVGIWSTS